MEEEFQDTNFELLSFQDLFSSTGTPSQEVPCHESRPVVKRSRSRRDRSCDYSGKWTKEEDTLLKSLTTENDPDWDSVAAHFPNRHKSEVQRRWENCFNPRIKKTPWTQEEDALIMSLLSRFGSVWKRIAKYMDGRPPDHIKNRYYGHLKPSLSSLKDSPPSPEKPWENPDLYLVPQFSKPKKPLNPAFVEILEQLKSSVANIEGDLVEARRKINVLDAEIAANSKEKTTSK